MKALMYIAAMLLMAASTLADAQPYQCNKWRNSLSQCKSCGDAPSLSPLKLRDSGGCISCGGFCTQIPPSPPQDGQPGVAEGASLIVANPGDLSKLGLSAPTAAAQCNPDFSGTPLNGYYALSIDQAKLREISLQSPDAANVIVAFRDRDVVPPLMLDGGDLTSTVAPTAKSVQRYFQKPDDEVAVEKAGAPLMDAEVYEAKFRVEDLADGRKLLIVDAAVRQPGGNLVKQVGESFAVELIERAGVTRPVAQVDGGTAQVYDLGASGPLSSF